MTVCSPVSSRAAPAQAGPWPELDPAFTLITSTSPGPVVFASPHSGRCYPRAFQAMSRLDRHALRASEDAWVDQLFAAAPRHGAALLCARFARAMVDANRDPGELDPDMYDAPLPPLPLRKSARLRAGLGVIPRLVAAHAPIYDGPIAYAEAALRLRHLHAPYHQALQELLQRSHARHGESVLIDCHSMPSASAAASPAGTADFVLGDDYGRACHPALADHVEQVLMDMGYRVARNAPYAGGYSTVRYGQPGRGRQALQIEINRALYMDERSLEKTAGFFDLRKDLDRLCESICTFARTMAAGACR